MRNSNAKLFLFYTISHCTNNIACTRNFAIPIIDFTLRVLSFRLQFKELSFLGFFNRMCEKTFLPLTTKKAVRFEYVPWKNVWFVPFPFVPCWHLSSNWKIGCKNYWNTIKFFGNKNDPRFESVLSNIAWFCLIFHISGQFWQKFER